MTYHSGIGYPQKNSLVAIDKLIRSAVRKWLCLPKDTPSAFFHSQASKGGLQICQFTRWIPLLKLRQYNCLENSGHPSIKLLLEKHTPKTILKAIKHPKINNHTCQTNEVYEQTISELYKMLDRRGLKHYHDVPYIHNWKIDGNRLQSGSSFITAAVNVLTR